jgi:hypothetical protein
LEHLAVQELVPKPGDETLSKAILPRLARFDMGLVNATPVAQAAQHERHELRAIVHPKRSGPAALGHQLLQNGTDTLTAERTTHLNGQRLARELVRDAQNPQFSTRQRPILDEVQAPNRVGSVRPL